MQPGRHFALDLDLPSHDAGLLYLTWEGQSLDGMVFSFLCGYFFFSISTIGEG
jgi:hypothetical protein